MSPFKSWIKWRYGHLPMRLRPPRSYCPPLYCGYEGPNPFKRISYRLRLLLWRIECYFYKGWT